LFARHYEAPAGAKLRETKVYKAGERVPLGSRVKDDVVCLEPGKPKLAVIVYRTHTPKAQTFSVIPTSPTRPRTPPTSTTRASGTRSRRGPRGPG